MERRVSKMHEMRNIEEDGKIYIEGYFAVYNEEYRIFSDWVEKIAPGAFDDALRSGADIKVLWNHNPDIVLGSTAAGTAKLSSDSKGLFGRVEINENDTDAMNGRSRILRGDVSGCSFGFDIQKFSEEIDEDGTYRTTIECVSPLYEVSPCTFPAYEATSVSARSRKQIDDFKNKRTDIWKKQMLEKMKGEGNA